MILITVHVPYFCPSVFFVLLCPFSGRHYSDVSPGYSKVRLNYYEQLIPDEINVKLNN